MMLIRVNLFSNVHAQCRVLAPVRLQLEMPSTFEIWLRLLSGTGGQDERPSVQSISLSKTHPAAMTLCESLCMCVFSHAHIWLFVCSTQNLALLMEWWKGSRLSAPARCPLLPCSVITLFNWLEVECPDLILFSDEVSKITVACWT